MAKPTEEEFPPLPDQLLDRMDEAQRETEASSHSDLLRRAFSLHEKLIGPIATNR